MEASASKPREALKSVPFAKGGRVHRIRSPKETEEQRLARRAELLAAIREKHARAAA